MLVFAHILSLRFLKNRYKGSSFHRIVPGAFIQGGDIIGGKGDDGEAVYNGGTFEDENFSIP